MGNEQVKIEQEFNGNDSNGNHNDNDITRIYNIEKLLEKKKLLDEILQTKRHILTRHQIEKINTTLNTIVQQISNLIHNSKYTASNTDGRNIANGHPGQLDLQMALKLFKFATPQFTVEDLKMRYHKLALATHPDKFGGDTTKFNLVKQSYEILGQHLIRQNHDKPHHLLKQGYQTATANDYYIVKGGDIPTSPHPNAEPLLDKDKFNPALFNKYYDEHRMADPNDTGYADWFKSNEDIEEDELDKYKGKISKDKFDHAFQKKKQASNRQVEVYKGNPMELISCNTGFTSLDGDDNIADFSKAPEARNGIGYTDLKTAYSSRGQFIDPNSVEFKTYKNVQEYEKARADISFTMTPEQAAEMQMRQEAAEIAEQKRLQRLAERDNAIAQHFTRVHTQMLGYAPKEPK